MKKFASINMVNYGSTGKIMLEVAEVLRKNGYEGYTFSTNLFSFRYKKLVKSGAFHKFYGSYGESFCHSIKAHLTGVNGKGSYFATKRLVSTLKKYKPDIIHLHNLHNFCINLKVLFDYVKKGNIPVVWTLHDCWTFTGHCAYFSFNGCEKYLTGCGGCKYYKEYPKVYRDGSKKEYEYKKECFSGANITFVCVSDWLTSYAKNSFINCFDIRTIKNGINQQIFKPLADESEVFKVREKYGIDQDKFILLGVSLGWAGARKGIDVIKKISERIDKKIFQIVLVGAEDETKKFIGDGALCIKETADAKELASIYSSCDLLINSTKDDTYPTVNLEAISCGTPVLTFNSGGSPEAADETCGSVVPCDDVDAFVAEIERIQKNRPFTKEACLKRALNFDKNANYLKYVELFDEIIEKSNKNNINK